MMAALAITSLAGCQSREGDDRVIDLWHQMRPEDRDVLKARIAAFEGAHPGVRVRELYKETEELRSGLVSAVLAGRGPEVIYGPSDVLGLYQAMGALADMSPWFSADDAQAFDERAESETVDGDIPDGWMGLDIGPKTVELYSEVISEAKTVIWNGPMGVFEWSAFAGGTWSIGERWTT